MRCPACDEERQDDSQFCPWCFSFSAPVGDPEPAVLVDQPVEAPVHVLAHVGAPTLSEPPRYTLPSSFGPPESPHQPPPGMSLPPDLFKTKKKRRIPGLKALASLGVILVTVFVALAFKTDMIDDIAHQGWRHERAAASAALLTIADLDGSWVQEPDDSDDVTVGLTSDMAKCLGVDAVQPVAEKASEAFVNGNVTLIAQVGVWRDDKTARRAEDLLARPDYGDCFMEDVQRELRKEDAGDALTARLVGIDPVGGTSAPMTRTVMQIVGPGGSFTFDFFEAFKGRTQVTLFAWSPGGVDQAMGSELMEKMLARA